MKAGADNGMVQAAMEKIIGEVWTEAHGAGCNRFGVSLDVLLGAARMISLSEYWPASDAVVATPATDAMAAIYIAAYGRGPREEEYVDVGEQRALSHVGIHPESVQVDYWIATPDESTFVMLSLVETGTPGDAAVETFDSIFFTFEWAQPTELVDDL